MKKQKKVDVKKQYLKIKKLSEKLLVIYVFVWYSSYYGGKIK